MWCVQKNPAFFFFFCGACLRFQAGSCAQTCSQSSRWSEWRSERFWAPFRWKRPDRAPNGSRNGSAARAHAAPRRAGVGGHRRSLMLKYERTEPGRVKESTWERTCRELLAVKGEEERKKEKKWICLKGMITATVVPEEALRTAWMEWEAERVPDPKLSSSLIHPGSPEVTEHAAFTSFAFAVDPDPVQRFPNGSRRKAVSGFSMMLLFVQHKGGTVKGTFLSLNILFLNCILMHLMS